MSYTELNESSPRSDQPSSIKIPMKVHQLASLHYINKLETEENFIVDNKKIESTIGVIADKVGSGKSLIVLSVIANNPTLHKNLNIYRSDGYINTIKVSSNNNFIDTNIIVVPHGIVKQWIKYITDYTNLKYITINSAKTFKVINENINILNNYDIVLVSSTKYNDFAKLFVNSDFNSYGEQTKVSRVFFDETDSIKIPACRKIHASYYWFISSSYKRLLSPNGYVRYANDYGELSVYYNYSLGFYKRVVIEGITCRGFIKDVLVKFGALSENITSKLIIKNSDSYIQSSFNLEDPNIIKIICKNPLSLNILSGTISNEVMSHLNAGDIQGAIEKLDCTKVEENNVVKTVTKDIEKSINNKKIELQMKSQMTYSSEQAKKNSLEKIKFKLKELEKKKHLIIDRLNENKICPICYDNINTCAISNCCKSSFCFECLSMWLSKNKGCPLCRQPMNVNNLIVVTDQENKQTKNELIDKIDHIRDILTNKINEDSKVLIFSEYNNTFNRISELLDEKNIKYSRLLGSGSSISSKVESFKSNKEDSIKVFMLNSHHFGSGLNLENTTDLIIYHNMSDELTNQIVGRAQRPGRKNKLNIYLLCNENEQYNSVF